MRKIKLQFECLTPVFIGSGQQIDHLNIMPYLDPTNGKNSKALYEIHPESVCQEEITKEFLKLIESKKEFLIPDEYAKFVEEYNLNRQILGDTFDEDIFNKIEENKKQGKVKNQIFIHLFSTGRMGVYVPGSSVKGMLKTPYIKHNLKYFKPKDGSAKSIEEDPFNQFLVRDSDHHKLKVHVGNIEVKNFPDPKRLRRHHNKNRVNSIPCYCQYLTPGSSFVCEIQDSLDKPYDFKQAHKFYLSAFEKLKEQVYQKDGDLSDAFEVKVNAIDMSKQEFLISLGGHGGVWTKKCLGSESFKRPQDQNFVSHKSSFRKSIDFRMPIGWCKGIWQEV